MRIVINTPNGTIGRPLTQRLLDAGADVTLLTRRPASVAHFAARGALVVEGSIDDPAALARALEGADALFWLSPPAYRPDANAWLERSARLAAAEVKKRGVSRVVVLSSVGAHTGPGTGPVGSLLAVENAFRAAAPDVVALRPGFFMENLLRDVPTIIKDGAIYSPMPTDKPLPLVAAVDIAGRAAAFLLDPTWAGHPIVGIHGPVDRSYRQIAAALTEELGRPIRHVEVTVEQMRQGMLAAGLPDFAADAYAELFQAVRDGRMDAAEPRTPETTTPTTVQEFARSTLLPALRAAQGDAGPDAAALVARSNALMLAWEHGDADAYRQLSAPDLRMSIPAYGLDVTGFEHVWAVRTSLKPLDKGPLDLHTVDNHVVAGRTVSAYAHVVSRQTGQFTQHAAVRFEFDAFGRLTRYHQDIVWPAATAA
ncbi:MAG TPA: NAD(P)H-binding protein [Polyangiaceae bacterium]|nr:NAD(P)H-binding protein [Polyangiaceae bacterium]